jgi:hypothetical protein
VEDTSSLPEDELAALVAELRSATEGGGGGGGDNKPPPAPRRLL